MKIKIHGPVPLKMFPDSDSLLDEMVQILGDRRRKALGLEDAQDFVASDETDLGHAVGVPQDDTCKCRTQGRQTV
jgi:hypothetical protein